MNHPRSQTQQAEQACTRTGFFRGPGGLDGVAFPAHKVTHLRTEASSSTHRARVPSQRPLPKGWVLVPVPEEREVMGKLAELEPPFCLVSGLVSLVGRQKCGLHLQAS